MVQVPGVVYPGADLYLLSRLYNHSIVIYFYLRMNQH